MPKLSFQYVRQEWTETLLEFLVRRFKYHNAEEWENLVLDGHVTVNGMRVGPDHLLETRHRVVYERPPMDEPAVDGKYEVLYEDETLLAVSKSGNIPTSPSGKYWNNCLVHLLMREHSLPGLYAAHRLDRETSGINLFAKTRQAAGALGQDFHQGRVRKNYLAVLRGHFPPGETYVSAPIRNNETGAVHIRQEVHPGGRNASTRFSLRALLPGASLVTVRPVTGRTHQIRVHAAYLGHPVWGDKLYGRSEQDFIDWVNSSRRDNGERHLLHANELVFNHPVTGAEVLLRETPRVLMDLFLTAISSPPAPSPESSNIVRNNN